MVGESRGEGILGSRDVMGRSTEGRNGMVLGLLER